MAGQQHPFPTGFPNVQQQMRNQFGGGQMVSGLMGPQQGMLGQQQLGGGVGPGMNPKALGMPTNQQVMSQQQPMPQQLQMQQQQQMQMQQANPLVLQDTQASTTPTAPQMMAPQVQQPQKKEAREFNPIFLCKIGQESVQELVSRMLEVFQLLKVVAPPNGTPQGMNLSNDRKMKINEHLKYVGILFKRLRMIYDKCNDASQLQGMEYTHIESLIPIKEEWDQKYDEKKASEAYRQACEEQKEVQEILVQRNRHLKEIIDKVRMIISEINTMMSMRRS
ncbi:mediator of RNA polymerase II transcription subunit 30 [Trichogramma pretiosum]|uniref:Mediator of RNA polymerase II transcription subunit 30 n=1 Tax=Trichogramma kaykai TaxID=54128 RepID=A0ABD2VSY5_9HYME|nr:mediator of RNA polymerase II transcription subunit 30 [Trichogramma pretiosum]